MKRVLALIMTTLMLLSMLAGCGAPKAETAAPATDAAPAADATDAAPAADAADGKVYNVGIIQLVTHDALDAATQGFQDALIAELGEANVVFDLQNAAGDSNTCSTIVNSFVSNEVDLIMANATPALQAAAAATADIPILGTSVTEYGVAMGIDNFSGTVGGNVSGTSDLAPLDKQAEMVKEWFPDAKNVGLLFCSAEPNSQYQVDTIKTLLEGLGYTCTLFAFSDTNDMAAVTQSAADNSDVIYVPTDNTVATTCTSFLKPFGNKGLIGLSISLEVSIAFSEGFPSLFKNPPGILPTEYNFSS